MTDIDEQRRDIEAGQKRLFCQWCPNDCEDRKKDPLTDEERGGCVASSGFAEESVKQLSDHGAVLKVLGEVPTTPPTYGDTSHTEGWEEGQYHMKQIGYTLTAPLVAPEGRQKETP